jgi:uncharacterized membrane protein YuzA (DUF378 family)
MMAHNKGLHMVTWILLIIGGLNWLLVGLFSWGVGNLFEGSMMWVAQLIYILVGLSAIYEIATHGGRCKECEQMSSKPMGGMGTPA